MTTSDERVVSVEAGRLCWQGFGDPTQATIVLVSGAAAAMDWWDAELCRRLADGGRHVVRYDHRDTGRSTTGEPGRPTYDADQLQRDCAALIVGLDTGPVHLVGVSMGGGIAQAIALRRPELVASLTLIATSPVGGGPSALPGPTPEVAASFDSPPPDPDWSDPTSYAAWMVRAERTFAGSIPVDEGRVRDLATTVHARSHDVAAAGNHWLAVGADTEGGAPLDVRDIAARTLVVHGSEDPLFPLPHGEALAGAVPGARLLVLPGMGHQVPPPETWDLLVPALLAHTATS